MCDPLAITTVVTAVVATTVSVEQQKAQAKAQAKTQKRANQNIKTEQGLKQAALARRGLQEADAADERAQLVRDETERALALAQTSAGEANVEGQSAASIARIIERRGQTGIRAVEKNDEFLQEQLLSDALGVDADARRKTNSLGPRIDPTSVAINAALAGQAKINSAAGTSLQTRFGNQ